MGSQNPNQIMLNDVDFEEVRDRFIALPADYRRVLFLGTTGAGKTTLVRQFIGTENFPSTSASKCTIHPTEIVLDSGSWRAVVTFASESTVRLHLEECITEAMLAMHRGEDDNPVLRRLLQHVDERFRFNYVLGDGPEDQVVDFGLADEDEEESGSAENIYALLPTDDFAHIDLDYTNDLLGRTLTILRNLVSRLIGELNAELGGAEGEDQNALGELFEEYLGSRLANDTEYREITNELIVEIKKRFDLLPQDGLTISDGWPQSWNGEWPVDKRGDFLRDILRFSSNNWRMYGSLLTPLVNGVRVAGPFAPGWVNTPPPRLVLVDGEGLGHTPESISSVSDDVSRNIVAADAVILVDNATQRMQAATAAAMREVAETGNANKLLLGFTHFDGVRGDDLRTVDQRAARVWDSVENQLHFFGQSLQPYVERTLRQRLQGATFYLSNLQNIPAVGSTAQQLQKLLDAIDLTERPQLANAQPVYRLADLAAEVANSVGDFHRVWRSHLGLESGPERSEHWARIKALSRRFAENINNGEYQHLRPVANLRDILRRPIISFVHSPLQWEGPEISEQAKQDIFDRLIGNIAERLRHLSARRLWHQQIVQWQRAYDQRGPGSTRVRARIIGNDIFIVAAPVGDRDSFLSHEQFLQAVLDELTEAATEVGARFVDVE